MCVCACVHVCMGVVFSFFKYNIKFTMIYSFKTSA